MLALSLAVKIKQRDAVAVEEFIRLIAATISEQEAIKTIFKPVLSIFTVEDRQWFDEMRKNAKWN